MHTKTLTTSLVQSSILLFVGAMFFGACASQTSLDASRVKVDPTERNDGDATLPFDIRKYCYIKTDSPGFLDGDALILANLPVGCENALSIEGGEHLTTFWDVPSRDARGVFVSPKNSGYVFYFERSPIAEDLDPSQQEIKTLLLNDHGVTSYKIFGPNGELYETLGDMPTEEAKLLFVNYLANIKFRYEIFLNYNNILVNPDTV